MCSKLAVAVLMDPLVLAVAIAVLCVATVGLKRVGRWCSGVVRWVRVTKELL